MGAFRLKWSQQVLWSKYEKTGYKNEQKNGESEKNSTKTQLFVPFWRQPKNRLKVAIFVQKYANFRYVCLLENKVGDHFAAIKFDDQKNAYITNFLLYGWYASMTKRD
jgi:hypothetical protein